MLSGKAVIISSTDKNYVIICKINYFPEPYIHSKNKIKVELDLSNLQQI